MAKIDISLVLACYNEGLTLTQSLEHIRKVLDGTHYKYEVICINDTSKDDTLKILRKFAQNKRNFKVFSHEKNVGRGGTVAEGIRLARGRVVGFIDVDLEVSPVYMPEFIRTIDGGADMVMAQRIYKEELSAVSRWVTSRVYVRIVRNFLGLDFKDTEAGYKFFNRNKILPVLAKVKDQHWFFDTEIVARAWKAKLKIVTVPVLFWRRTDKKSTVRIIHDSLEYLQRVWDFKSTFK